jgi:hypothetical protein
MREAGRESKRAGWLGGRRLPRQRGGERGQPLVARRRLPRHQHQSAFRPEGSGDVGEGLVGPPEEHRSRPADGHVEGSLGDYNLKRLQAVLNVPLADTFKVRLGIDRNKRGGYMKNRSGIGPDAYNDVDYFAARLSIVAELIAVKHGKIGEPAVAAVSMRWEGALRK